jgi:hypothetical protein
MTRQPNPGFDVRIADWLEADPDFAPPDLMRTVESALPSIPQRRVVRLPWRFTPMSTFAKLAVAAVALIAVGTVGIIALQPRAVPSVGSAPSATPSPSPSPTASPSPTPAASLPPPLSETFSSPTHDISIAYPAGWAVQPATEPWTASWPTFEDPFADLVYDPTLRDHLFIALASQGLNGKDGAQWAADTLALDGCTASSPVTIDGASGLLATGCDVAVVAVDGRGYAVMFYTSGDEAWLEDVYDRAWFEELLTTVDLQPAARASVAPSP